MPRRKPGLTQNRGASLGETLAIFASVAAIAGLIIYRWPTLILYVS